MAPILRNFEDRWVLLTSVLAAMLLASHQVFQNTEFDLILNYLYWVIRVLIETAIFVGVLVTVERYVGRFLTQWGSFAVAIALSLIPYALTITAIDLILGLPELGFNDDSSASASTLTAFAYELLYLLDNHTVLCLMLLLPRLIQASPATEELSANKDSLVMPELRAEPNVFMTSFEPPLRGELYSVEAQEHYVQVYSSEESRLVLYRFSDVVRQMPKSLGMQVHRSHWVAFSAVKNIVLQGQTMKLALVDGSHIPVSRTFRSAAENRFTLATA